MVVSARFDSFAVAPDSSVVRFYAVGDEAMQAAVDIARLGRVAADIETAGLDEDSYTVKAIIIANDTHAAVLDGFNPRHVQAARDAFNMATRIDFWNSTFDVPPLYLCGAMSMSDIDKVVDGLIWARMALTDGLGGRGLADMEKLVFSSEHAEKDLFNQWAKVNKYSKAEAFKKVTYADRAYTMYGGHDGILTHRLSDPVYAMAMKQLTDHPFGVWGADRAQAEYLLEREQIVNRVMLKRSATGLAVDLGLLQREQDRIVQTQSDIAEKLRWHGIDKPTNPGQLVAALEKSGAIPHSYPRTGKTNKPSTAGKNLETLTHPAALLYAEYGDHNKLFNYLENARVIAERTDGRLHPVVAIMKAVTGRTSYGNPALQQFTVPAREAILGDEPLGSIDWSQIEPVLGALLAGDTEPLKVYETSGDLYTPVAEAAGVARSPAKAILLAKMYGQSEKALAERLGMPEQEAEAVQRKVARQLPRTMNLIGWAQEWTREYGKTFTLSGRIIDVDLPRFAYRGSNYLIQGSGYDLLAEAVVEMHRRGISDHLHLSFHDELIVGMSVADEVMEIMSTPPARLVELLGRSPVLRVDIAELGDRWRTPPKSGCARCGSEKSMAWVGEWVCGSHKPITVQS